MDDEKMSRTAINARPGQAATEYPDHVAAIAEMVADQIANGYSMHGLVSAEHFGRRYRYSREQARHVLNNAARYGAIEKVRVSSLGVDVPHFGAQFGFRPPDNGHAETPPKSDQNGRSRDIDRDHPNHCNSCGAPLDALGSCTGSCDPNDDRG